MGTVLLSDTANVGWCVTQLLFLGLFVEKMGPGENCSREKLFYLIYCTCGELCRAIYVVFPICSNVMRLNQTNFVAEPSPSLLRRALFFTALLENHQLCPGDEEKLAELHIAQLWSAKVEL